MLDFLDNQYTKQRIQKAQQLRELGHNPYNNVCVRTLCNAAFVAKFAHLQKEQREDSARESVVGRIRFLRLMGKAAFVKIQDDSGILQLYLCTDDLGESFGVFKKHIEVGDIIAASGFPFVTKMGELSLHATQLTLLTKAINP